MTAIEWLLENLPIRYKNAILNDCIEQIKEAKEMEYEQKKEIALHFMMLGIKNKGDYSKIDFYKEIDRNAD
jgi:hypothetical protein